jgi:hypothetical protein
MQWNGTKLACYREPSAGPVHPARCTDPALKGDDDTERKLNQISHLQRRPRALP